VTDKQIQARRAMRTECLNAIRELLNTANVAVELATCADDRRWHIAEQLAFANAISAVAAVQL